MMAASNHLRGGAFSDITRKRPVPASRGGARRHYTTRDCPYLHGSSRTPTTTYSLAGISTDPVAQALEVRLPENGYAMTIDFIT